MPRHRTARSRFRTLARLAVLAAISVLAPRRAAAQWYSYAFGIPNPSGQAAVYEGDGFGARVAAMGHNVLVTAFEDTVTAPNLGAVYLFDGDSGLLLQTFANTATPPAFGSFGWSIATIGGTVVIGSPFEPAGGDQVGAVYLFDAATGALLHRVTDPSPSLQIQEQFGYALAIVDGLIAVAAPRKDNIPGRNPGAIFLVDPQTGAIVRTLPNPFLPPPVTYYFGLSLATLGDRLVVGGYQAMWLVDAVTGAVLQSFANPPPVDLNSSQFGFTAGVLGDRPVTSDPSAPGGTHDGRIYVFDATSGALELTVTNPNPGSFNFGVAFAVVGSELLTRPNDSVKERAALLDGATGAVRQTFFNPGTDPVSHDEFGRALAATDTGFVVGAPGWGPRSAREVGAVYVYDACGNGVRTAGEQCDDGNLAAGDGCSPTCTLELCGSVPAAGCRTVPSRKSTVVIGDNFKDAQDVLTWKWSRGQQTLPTDFGNPLATTNYALCIYDDSAAPQPRRVSAALAGSTWTAPTPTFFSYANPARTPSGLSSVALHAGPDGNASITVKGKGPRVEPPALPLTLPVTVQLRNSDTGACWTATYAGTVLVNDTKKFRALSD